MTVFSSPVWERGWPFVGTLAAVAVWWWLLGAPFPPNPDALFGAAATVASVFASFLGVSKAIILTIKATETFRILSNKGYAGDLFRYLRSGIFSSVLFASLSIIGFFIDHNAVLANKNIYNIFSGLWIAAGCLSLLTYLRITNILFKLLKIV